MNNFFASVECAKNPSLCGKPVAVCGSIENRHGIILAKNYIAKSFGITTGEPVVKAKAKCRDLITVEANYDDYLDYSARARKIYDGITDRIEPMGIDEVWLDVTGSTRMFGDGEQIANMLRKRIKEELGVTISVGISFNKIFAKLGSDMKKPDAVTSIPRDSFRDMIWDLPACDMLGVGRALYPKMKSYGIYTIGQLARAYPPMIERNFGKMGLWLIEAANGRNTDPVLRCDFEPPMKSVGHGTTTYRDMQTPNEVKAVMISLCEEIGHKLIKYKKRACGVSIMVRDNKLCRKQYRTRLSFPTNSYTVISSEAFDLFTKKHIFDIPLRSVTVTAIDLCPESFPIQTDLFCDTEYIERKEKLDLVTDSIWQRFGTDKLKYCVLMGNRLTDVGGGIGFGKAGASNPFNFSSNTASR